ncbi:IS5 family transposase [Dankookia sp. P2]|uniref:IS5 family transposase n=1 Tax=Dankookia sp. P2 TaxID=3423955 RepID=UPI003D67E88B
MGRRGLSDAEWTRLRALLPESPRTGRPHKDHRLGLDALLWLARTGAPWRDLPERFGPWRSIATRFYRWTRCGLWEHILSALRQMADARGGIDWEVHMVDGTNIRAHRHAAGGKGGQHAQALGRSRGGFGSKLHLRCDRRGRPMAFVLTPGERNERMALPDLLAAGAVRRGGRGPPRLRPKTLVGDRGYTGQPARDLLRRRGIAAAIPQLRTEKRPRLMDWNLYRERNVVERLVGRLKEYRRVATRYDKLAACYLAFVQLTAVRMWL